MIKSASIKIRYPGDCISVNHYLGRRKNGGYYVKPETKLWKEEFQWLLKKCYLEDFKLPLEIKCSGYFTDERAAPDLSNLSKVIMDSVAELIKVNDKDFRWHDGERLVGYKEPFLLIAFTDSGDTPDIASIAPQSKSSPAKVKRGIINHKEGK